MRSHPKNRQLLGPDAVPRGNSSYTEPHLRVDDLLGDVVEVVPAVVSPQPGVEGGGQATKLPLGAAVTVV